MDYHDLDIDDVGHRAPEGDRAPAEPSTKDPTPRDSDPLTGWHTAENTRLRIENGRLREQLHTDRATYRSLCGEYETYRREHPPF